MHHSKLLYCSFANISFEQIEVSRADRCPFKERCSLKRGVPLKRGVLWREVSLKRGVLWREVCPDRDVPEERGVPEDRCLMNEGVLSTECHMTCATVKSSLFIWNSNFESCIKWGCRLVNEADICRASLLWKCHYLTHCLKHLLIWTLNYSSVFITCEYFHHRKFLFEHWSIYIQ